MIHISGIILAKYLTENRYDIVSIDKNGDFKIIEIVQGGIQML